MGIVSGDVEWRCCCSPPPASSAPALMPHMSGLFAPEDEMGGDSCGVPPGVPVGECDGEGQLCGGGVTMCVELKEYSPGVCCDSVSECVDIMDGVRLCLPPPRAPGGIGTGTVPAPATALSAAPDPAPPVPAPAPEAAAAAATEEFASAAAVALAGLSGLKEEKGCGAWWCITVSVCVVFLA